MIDYRVLIPIDIKPRYFFPEPRSPPKLSNVTAETHPMNPNVGEHDRQRHETFLPSQWSLCASSPSSSEILFYFCIRLIVSQLIHWLMDCSEFSAAQLWDLEREQCVQHGNHSCFANSNIS